MMKAIGGVRAVHRFFLELISFSSKNKLKISVILHSYLRELLPPGAKGAASLDLPESSSVQDVFDLLKLPPQIAFAVNDHLDQDHSRLLHEGDTLHFFRPAAGG